MTEEPAALVAVQSAAYAGLDTLLGVMPLDLCGYLHVGEQLGPQLYLRRPMLADLDPAEAFRLFSSLRDLLEGSDEAVTQADVEHFDAMVVRSTGAQSRGLWVAGRRDGPMTDAEVTLAANLAQGIMLVCHLAEAATTPSFAASVVRVAVDTTEAGVNAEVALGYQGGTVIGQGKAPTPVAAVAWATVDALDPSLKVVAADEDGIDQSRVVLTLLRNDQGDTAVGAALADAGSLRAAAEATISAITSFRG